MEHLTPTPLPDVNAVLTELVRRLRQILGKNLVGVYLQGSFAVGDFTTTSDIDFMVIVESDTDGPTLEQLQQMHSAFSQRTSYWPKHLEGSYAPAAIIRRLAPEPRDPPGESPRPAAWRDPGTGLPAKVYPFLFLGNGWDHLVRSEHDNTLVARWVVRERSIALFGPDPASLIDRVSADELRSEVRTNLSVYTAPYLAGNSVIDAVWMQSFFVTLLCRMLHTVCTGEIRSKRRGTEWALKTLPSKWHVLIERAAATWAGSQERWMDQPQSDDVAATLEFMRYANDAVGTF
jgi:predicted nucleotidyltransferase